MAAESGATSILVRVVCLNPPVDAANAPPGIFGLQDKDNILSEGVARDDGALTFSCTLQVKPAEPPNFLGPFAHGTPTARFLYLSLRPDSGASTEWIKRIKVPLNSVTWAQVEAATLPGMLLQATVDGRQSATVPIIGGWQVVSAKA
jgi:hypothetical protein